MQQASPCRSKLSSPAERAVSHPPATGHPDTSTSQCHLWRRRSTLSTRFDGSLPDLPIGKSPVETRRETDRLTKLPPPLNSTSTPPQVRACLRWVAHLHSRDRGKGRERFHGPTRPPHVSGSGRGTGADRQQCRIRCSRELGSLQSPS